MDKKARQKKEIKALKKEREEHLTNWYMINMCWSIFGIIVLYILQRVYNWASGAESTLKGYEISLWIVAGLAVVGAVVLLVLGLKGVIKNGKRARNYSVFLFIVAGASAWVVLWRVYIRAVVAKIFGTSSFLYTGSFWGIWLLMIACVAWIVIAFVIYLVRLSKLRKSHK